MRKDSLMIRDYYKDERPRERMIHDGPKSLSNQEILAILLRTGTKEESVVQLAHRVIERFEGLRTMRDATIEELTEIKGIGEAKATQLFAAIELGRRMTNLNFDDRFVIRTPEDCANYLMHEMRFLPQEHFVVLFLNTKNQVIHKQSIFIGSLNRSVVHPREIFREAVKRSAASFVCAHNHPSGDPTPSKEDIESTKRLVSAGKIIGIEMLDHLVIGENKFTSMKAQGFV